jgi:hypothetical protein
LRIPVSRQSAHRGGASAVRLAQVRGLLAGFGSDKVS